MDLRKAVDMTDYLGVLRTKILAEYSDLAVDALSALKKAGARPKLKIDEKTLEEMARKSSIMNGMEFFNIGVQVGDIMFFGSEATDVNTGTTVDIKKLIVNFIKDVGNIIDDWVISTVDRVANSVYRELNKIGALGKEGRSEVTYVPSKRMSVRNLNSVVKLVTARRMDEDAILEALDTATGGAYVMFYLADGDVMYLYPFAKEVAFSKPTNRLHIDADRKLIEARLKEVTGLTEGVILNPWVQNLLG